jgi:hypothetical protein
MWLPPAFNPEMEHRKREASMSERRFGTREEFSGYVTTLASIQRRSTAQLEQALGFVAGSLAAGYVVYALADPVGIGDFEWKDQTTYSDGWHFDPVIGEYVQRHDELRAHWGKRNQYSEPATDVKLQEILASHARRLNVRYGPERIAKVLAKTRIAAFPDSPLRGIPQWKLRFCKSFTLYADVASGRLLT